MILSLKFLGAAGLAASLAAGGTLATQAPASPAPPAASAAVAAGDSPVPPQAGGEIELRHGLDDGGNAAVSTSTTVTSTTVTSTTAPPTSTTTTEPPAAPAATTVHTVADAGTVTVGFAGGTLTVTDVHPNIGWTANVEQAQGRELEVTFVNGLRRIDFKAELEDGRVQTRVEDRQAGLSDDETKPDADDNGAEVEVEHQGGAGQTDSGDDHSGPGGGGDDHSGHGGGSGSGSGSSGSDH